MFFALSKLLWTLVRPDTLLLLALGAAAALQGAGDRGRKAGRRLVLATAVFAALVAVFPVGRLLIATLENRFPPLRAEQVPAEVEGVIVLSGIVDSGLTAARGQLALNSAAERLTEFASLARRHPQARLVFTGGSGDLFDQSRREADTVAPFIRELGVEPSRVVFENRSRNTAENASFSRGLVNPRPGGAWVLVTSAFHMPRSVGCFRKAGWTVIPYPVDYMTRGDESLSPMFDLAYGLGSLATAIHEWLGLFVYWLTDRSDSPFPGPDDHL